MLNQTYSVPARLVHACLQVTEQVWQPMHLSRFMTIAICAMTLMQTPPVVEVRASELGHQYSTFAVRLRIIVTSSRLLPIGPM